MKPSNFIPLGERLSEFLRRLFNQHTGVPGRELLPTDRLMEAAVAEKCWHRALRRVMENRGGPGVDNLTVDELPKVLRKHGAEIRSQLLQGAYRPQPLRKVFVPKFDSDDHRVLGIPTVLDRFVQHTLMQVLQPLFERRFSRSSFGFRPGRSAHQAIRQGRRYVAEGLVWVVHVDLDNFFDRVPHGLLLERLQSVVRDDRVLQMIHRFLKAPFLSQWQLEPRGCGTPQGSPLSPLLANVFLHEWDMKLDKERFSFCRYADDVSIYVPSQREGERVLREMSAFIESRLRLKVNREKSLVAPAWGRKFLGYTLAKEPPQRLKPAAQSWDQLRKNVLTVLASSNHANLSDLIQTRLNPLLRGWANYFAEDKAGPEWAEFDAWLRCQLRAGLHGVGSSRADQYFDQAGLISLARFVRKARKSDGGRPPVNGYENRLRSRHAQRAY